MRAPKFPLLQKKFAIAAVIFFILCGGLYPLIRHPGSAPRDPESPSRLPAAPAIIAAPALPAASQALTRAPVQPPRPAVTAPAPEQASANEIKHYLDNKKIPASAVPQDQCVTITYRHKAMPGHEDEEACSHHKNVLTLKDAGATRPQAVCLRVDGTPVHYLTVKGHADELLFGAVAGPKSVVTVHYCTSRGQGCATDDCAVPTDEFMEAIGGADGGEPNAKLGQWDPSAPADAAADVMARLDGTVKKELQTNEDLNGRAPSGELFRGWIGEAKTTACGIRQAKN